MALNTPLARFDAATTFRIPFNSPVCTLLVDANSGDVTVEVLMDEGEEAWLTYDTYTQDSVIKLDCNGCVVKITPSGGAYATLVRP